jgi:hypothetical protein
MTILIYLAQVIVIPKRLLSLFLKISSIEGLVFPK